MIRASLIRGLRGPLMTGWPALLCALAAVSVPTILRAAINGSVVGCEFTPYLPFVLVASILIGWLWAAAVAIASIAILGGLFVGPSMNVVETSCFVSSAATFVLGSAMIIGVAAAVRRASAGAHDDEERGGVTLSVDRGDVWASWRGQARPVRLGPKRSVSQMMRDFLAQSGDDDGS
jgi:hypothetical protein